MSEERELPQDVNSGGDGGEEPHGPGPPKRDLPSGLKPFEAALASLGPRGDRLDYDLIMFRAGQLSVSGGSRIAFSGRSMVWPAGLGTMTAVAAALLVMLLARPEKVVEKVRIVRVPAVEDGSAEARQADEGPADRRRDRHVRPHGPEVPAELGPVADSPVWAGIGWAGHDRWDRLSGRAAYLEGFDRMLREDAKPWTGPSAISVDVAEPVEIPVPNRRWLETLLDEQARAEPDFGGGQSHLRYRENRDSPRVLYRRALNDSGASS
jgi:hypothetical protein